MSKFGVPTLTGPRRKVAVHHVTWLLECCASGGGGACRRSRKRTNLSATRTMTVTITTPIKRHSNVLWKSRSIPACTATPDWNHPPTTSLVKLQEQTREYHWIKGTPKRVPLPSTGRRLTSCCKSLMILVFFSISTLRNLIYRENNQKRCRYDSYSVMSRGSFDVLGYGQ